MKKRLATLSLVSLVCITSLASCDTGYNYRDGVMLYCNGTAYTTDELFQSYGMDTSSGMSAYYKVINNIVTEATVAKTDSMIKTVNQKIENFRTAADDAARQNGTSSSEELEKSLDSLGFDTMEQLENSYYLEEKKTKADSDFYTDAKYTETYIPEFIQSIAPYHVKHILVKVDAASGALYNGTISKDDAEDISNVVSRLALGENFGSVAQTKSEDEGSAASFGDLGIMSTKTGYVAEFKYNLYSYDAFFNPNVEDKQAVKDATFSTDASVNADYEALAGSKAYGIPYSAIKGLNFYADKTKDNNGMSVKEASEINYPRNVLFNNYFNNHGISFIYLDDVADTSDALDSKRSEYYTASDFDAANASNRFQTVDGVSNNLKTFTETASGSVKHISQETNIASSKKVLCDELGNPILVTRAGNGTGDGSYQGIHFIVAQKDPFTKKSDEYESKLAELKAYYTLDKPSTTTTSDNLGNTFVGFINSTDRNDYTTRVNTLKTAVKSMDANFSYRMFNEALASAESGQNPNNVTITLNNDIKTNLTSYISNIIASTNESETRTYDASWKSFLQLLEVYNQFSNRIIPAESGIDAFNNNKIEDFNNDRAGIGA